MTTEIETVNTTSEIASANSEGVRARRTLAMKQFVPDQDWIMRNVVAKGKGSQSTVGRIWGVATGFESKVNEYQGQQLHSIAIKGVFQSESYVTGEVTESTIVYFPMAYAEKIANMMDSDPDIKLAEVDVDIGLEATGKTIPYEWVVIAFRDGAEMAVLKRIKGSRGRPANAAVLALPGATAGLIEGQVVEPAAAPALASKSKPHAAE